MAKYRWVLTSLGMLLVFLVSSLASANSDQPNSLALFTQVPPEQTQPNSTAEDPLEVMIADEGIFPPVLFIPAGTTLRWTNQTSQTQRLEGGISGAESGLPTIYLPLIFKDTQPSGSNTPLNSEATNNSLSAPTTWDSGEILPNASFSLTFDQSGQYTYLLTGSPTVTGTIVVQQDELTGPSLASILAVTVKTDDKTNNGNCTLREAIIAANTNQAVDACPAGGTADMIVLASGVYSLTLTGQNEDAAAKGDLDITSKITITGAGDTIINAKNLSDRIFHVGDFGKLTLTDVTLAKGSGFGGGIYNRGSLILGRSTITGSSGGANIGGGFKNDGTATLTDSTISANTADFAAGIYNRGILTLNNSTVSGNTASSQGGGIKNEGTLTLVHTTVTSNTAQYAGGIRRHTGTVNFKNSIIAGNTALKDLAHADCDNLSSGSQGYNLLGQATGCPNVATDLTVSPAAIFTTVLGPLQNNGGNTLTHALLTGSPAIDAVPLANCPLQTDQRGLARPQNTACDIGSFEFAPTDPAQTGPIFTVNTTDDPGEGVCTVAHCSLREAINAANARPNTPPNPDELRFNIAAGGPQTISPTTTLPAITGTLKIDGGTQPGYVNTPLITLNGSLAGQTVNGLELNTSSSAIQKLIIRNFGGTGIQITSGISNTVLGNRIFSNGKLGLDLGGDNVTPNDFGTAPAFDPDAGANNLQNFPVLTGVFPDGTNTHIEGRLHSTAVTTFTLEFFANPTCDPTNFGEGELILGSKTVTTDASGDAIFTDISFPIAVPVGQFVTATATGPGGTSEFSQCVPVGLNNDSWFTALELDGTLAATQFLDKEGQSRWYKFTIQPNSQVIVTLTGLTSTVLPANYDLTVYKDIQTTFDELTAPNAQDLVQLNAEFASDAFAGDAIARAARSPDAIARAARSPEAFATTAFSPDAIARAARSPDALARAARSPDAFAADAFAPDAYSPDALARAARSPDAIARAARSPEVFSSAQTLSLIGVSAFEGTSGEGIIVNTWNNTGDFYVRVKGRNGAFSLDAPFHVDVELVGNSCNSISPITPTPVAASGPGFKTIILTDLDRMEGSPADKNALLASLDLFKNRAEVAGVVVDVGSFSRVDSLNDQADDNPACPYAKNLVAGAIKDVVTAYRNANPDLAYVVIIGNDDVIPFFRYADRALLGPESDYIPPVDPFTTSEASLRLDYVLGQDEYGSQVELSVQVSTLPIPDLAVGRLVETAADVKHMLDTYLLTSNGVVSPRSGLVTGYDFFADAAGEIQQQLESGLGVSLVPTNTLITPRNVSPLDPGAWSAADLRTRLLGSRHDVIFLGGHFSANSALAADYESRLLSTEVASSLVDLSNSLIFSIGCHSGYNIVNKHGLPGVTDEPDWAQTFAQKGATFIGGTGYQYGDTDFLEYSERIYLEFSRQLRLGSGPVPVGQALVAAKQIYLAQTPQLRPMHEKSLLEATLFGLPMLSIDMPVKAPTPPGDTSIATIQDAPGATLGLKIANISLGANDINIDPSIVQLQDIDALNSTVEALYLSIDGKVLANPNEPVLPLLMRNVSGPGTLVMRGVGFRGGNYADTAGVRALTGAPTTEIRSVHMPFLSEIFYPVQPWSVNYFEALANGGTTTRLAVTPAQFKSTSPGSETNTLRQYSSMDFRLYYSDNTATFSGFTPALASAPIIAKVSAPITAGDVNFRIRVIGDPVAGIQEVWVTYTECPDNDICTAAWQSLDLTQSAEDSTLWEGTFDLGSNPQNIRYMVQAVNGVGLVSMATNLGAYYTPGVDETQLTPTALSLDAPTATSGPYGAEASFSAVLRDQNNQPLSGRVVIFGLGSQGGLGLTGSNGRATVTLPLLGTPDQYDVRAAFSGDAQYIASAAPNRVFEITKQNTSLCLEPLSASRDDACVAQPVSLSGFASDDALLVATLKDATGRRLFEKNVVFVVTGSGVFSHSETVITDFLGRAPLGNLPLPPANYTVKAYYNGEILLSTGQTVTLDDPRYNPSAQTANLTLQNVPPVAVNDSYSVNEDMVLNVPAPGVLGNDTDIDTPALTAILVTGPGHGTLTLKSNGSFVYTPTLNFKGSDSFTYKANDGSQNSNIVTVTITINSVNDAPVAVNDAYSVNQKDKLIVAAPGVLGNDTDVEANTLTAILVSGPSHGSLTLKANGAFTYTPAYSFYGTDTFTYKANDGLANSNIATVTITVNPKILDCSTAEAYPEIIWQPNNKFKSINIKDVGDSYTTIKIVSIFQDEQVGNNKHTSPDGQGIGTPTAQIRAERDGSGNGRIYHISFTASGKHGGSCSGKVRVAVPHDQSGEVDFDAIDGGPLYDSTKKSY